MNEEIGRAFLPTPDRAHPMLPLAEYVVKSGHHTLARQLAAEKKPHADWKHCYMARYEFPNGYIASVISGKPFYCRDDAPYEVMWTTNEDAEPYTHGYVSEEGLMLLLIKISQQPERKTK